MGSSDVCIDVKAIPVTPGEKSNSTVIAIAVVASVLGFFIIVAIIYFVFKKKRMTSPKIPVGASAPPFEHDKQLYENGTPEPNANSVDEQHIYVIPPPFRT